MNRSIRRLCTIGLVVALTACSNTPTNQTTFQLVVINNTADTLEIFSRPEPAGGSFEDQGSVGGNRSAAVLLLLGSAYTVRLVRVGQPIDSFAYEKTVATSAADVTWVVP